MARGGLPVGGWWVGVKGGPAGGRGRAARQEGEQVCTWTFLLRKAPQLSASCRATTHLPACR